jgi:hypothetical protein
MGILIWAGHVENKRLNPNQSKKSPKRITFAIQAILLHIVLIISILWLHGSVNNTKK